MTLALLASNAALAGEPRSHIPREQLEQMFSQIRANTSWNMDGPMLWGFYFTAHDRQPLERASKLLEQDGYRLVDIHKGDERHPDEPNMWWLHLERVEQLNVDSLNARNAAFDDFARTHGLAAYDGMDVGPATVAPPSN